MINIFSGKNSFLSNFYICKDGYCLEKNYQASKFLTTSLPLFKEIMDCKSPYEAKKIARKNKNKIRKDWHDISLTIMEALLMEKFSSDPERTMLKNTGSEELIEGNHWHDNFYGACYCERCIGKEKLNHLGKLLMKIRSKL